MSTWVSTNFTGGAAGTAASVATEPMFAERSGTMTYRAVPGAGQGVEPAPATYGQFWINDLGGRTTFRLGWRVTFGSSTATSAYYFMASLNNGTNPVIDVGLRNAAGRRHVAARNNFTYFANPNTDLLAASETWTLELLFEAGAVTLYAWDSPSSSSAPTYTWTTSTATAITRIFLGNGANNTAVTATISDVWATDGERLTPGPTSGSVEWALNGYATDTEFAVNVKATGETTAGIEYDTTGTFTAPTYVAATSKGDGYWQATATGLPSKVRHYWRAVVDSVPSAVTGSLTTLPPAGVEPHTFAWGSCWWDTAPADVFTNIVARDPAFVTLLGDYGYTYITGGPNGNTSPTDVATVRANRLPSLTAAGSRTLTASRPIHYTYSDCDGAGANSDSTTGGHATGAVQQAYRQQHAHPTLPLSNCGARSWVVGRVRYVLTDELATATPRRVDSGDPLDWQNPSKRKMDAAQTAWFLGELDAAMSAGQAVVWFGDGPWIEPGGSSPGASNTYQSWAWYHAQRVTLGNEIATRRANGLGIVRLHGDTHTLFVDDGTNNPWGGFPTASAAPFNETAQSFGVTTSGPKWPASSTNSSRQYGVGSVVDDGDTLTLTIRGYSSTTSAPTEVERYAQTFTLLEPESGAGGSVVTATATLVGSGRKGSNSGSALIATVAPLAVGRKGSNSGSTLIATVAPLAVGRKVTSSGFARLTSVAPAGAGSRRHVASSSRGIAIGTSSAGLRVAHGASIATALVVTTGAGARVRAGQGGSVATVVLVAPSTGSAIRSGGSAAVLQRTHAATGTTTRRGGGAVALALVALGQGHPPAPTRDLTILIGRPVWRHSEHLLGRPGMRYLAIGTPRRTT